MQLSKFESFCGKFPTYYFTLPQNIEVHPEISTAIDKLKNGSALGN